MVHFSVAIWKYTIAQTTDYGYITPSWLIEKNHTAYQLSSYVPTFQTFFTQDEQRTATPYLIKRSIVKSVINNNQMI